MILFPTKYFSKQNFSLEQITKYLNNALRDLEIAKENQRPEIRFNYSYSAFIKGGIVLLAKIGRVKVRSVPGHHVQIIKKMSRLLNNRSIQDIGNIMRLKRNLDLYDGGIFISEKESKDFYNFVKKILFQINSLIKKVKNKKYENY